ncbi:uncharacterized protein BO80DRAFT_479303 [Aspergillus ibericus CBS 121593]|uniref:Rootletin n=1 Tax=Aspergillus ibericus CBS 121593 TaxID=1448316 RepID=A0A395GVS9_9EURO|nr:hypothetical protein BO80DRAFT_479303 [Aspergillus ibericus CBS 121593]RAK98797.1 hypothetical protein BO80DRAFT_479303 [Aspergillus ibericus CBS 121593]
MPNEKLSVSGVETLTCPDAAKVTNASSYDEAEELLLLHMADNHEPVSPKLKVIMALEEGRDTSSIGKQRQVSPLLMERPKSSGIDMTAFCFGRPTQGPNSFSLQPARRSPLGTTTQKTDAPLDRGTNQPMLMLVGIRSSSYPENAESGTGNQRAALQNQLPEMQNPHSTSPDTGNATVDGVQSLHASHSKARPVPQDDQLSLANPRMMPPENAALPGLKEGAKRLATTRPLKSLPVPNHRSEQSKAHDQHVLARINNKAKVGKRQGSNRSQGPNTKKPSIMGSENGGSRLSEEELFHLLIDRIRDREETAIAAFHLREQMEAEAMKVAEENHTLKSQLALSNKQVQKQASELKVCESRLGVWRSKITKFKGFLNELGCDFQNLRGEAIQLKATRKELFNERDEITTSINEARAHLAEASTSVDKRRDQLLKVEGQLNLLKQDLKNAQDRANYLLSQLSDEKKRSKLLEMYIQDCSRTQTTRMGQIMSHQHEMMKNLDTAFKTLGHQHDASLKIIQENLHPDVNECLASLRKMSEMFSSDEKDAQVCKDLIQSFASRMDSMMLQINADVGKGAEANASLTQTLKEQVTVIEKQIASDLDLSKKLSVNSDNYGSLLKALDPFTTTTDKIACSVQGLEAKDIGLADQMNALRISLAELQIPQPINMAKEEACRYEMIVAEMRDKMEHMSEDLKVAQEALKAKELETEAIRISLSESSSKANDAESRARAFELEAAALRDEVKSVESRVREELNRASVVSREQGRARYDQQLHELLREKVEVERNMERILTQLAEARLTLVESEDKAKEREDEMQLILTSKEKENEELKCRASESAAKLEDRNMELARLTELQSLGETQLATLHHEIEKATSRITILEKERTEICNESHKLTEHLQAKHDVLHAEFQEKEAECALIQTQLTATMSEKSDLECRQQKSKEEMEALTKRVQESEHGMKKVRDILSQVGISTPGKTFTEVCSILETTLRTAQNKTTDPQSNSPGGKEGISCSNLGTSTPQKNNMSLGQELYKATEVIYRAQSIQASIISSPFPRENSTANQQHLCSAQNPNIVPFSSIRHQSSPMDSSVFGNDQDELAAMLLITPEKKVITECDNTSKSDETQATKRAVDMEQQEKISQMHAPGMAADEAAVTVKAPVPHPSSESQEKGKQMPDSKGDIKANTTKAKSVTFETQSPTSAGLKRKLPEAKNNDAPSSVQSMSLIEDRPARVNRRTYSRARHSMSRGAAKATDQAARPSAGGIADRDSHATTRANANKRTRASIDPPAQKPQTKPVTEYFERKSSPTKLASGSSRTPSMNASQSNNQKWPARSGRGSRRTRGEQPIQHVD